MLNLKRAAVLAAAAASLSALAVAAPAGAATSPTPHAGLTSAVFKVTYANRHDNGHGVPSQWLLYGEHFLPSGVPVGNLASTITITKTGANTFSVTMTATGSGQTVQGAGAPNATLPGNLSCFPFTVALDSRSGLTETIHSTSGPVINLNGDVFTGDSQSFSQTPLLAFPSGGTVTVNSYFFSYSPVPNAVNSGQAAASSWTDSSDPANNDGNSSRAGQVRCG